MPIVRKIIDLGNSRAVTLPATWLQEIEKRRGEPIEEVLMELSEDIKIYARPKENDGLLKVQ